MPWMCESVQACQLRKIKNKKQKQNNKNKKKTHLSLSHTSIIHSSKWQLLKIAYHAAICRAQLIPSLWLVPCSAPHQNDRQQQQQTNLNPPLTVVTLLSKRRARVTLALVAKCRSRRAVRSPPPRPQKKSINSGLPAMVAAIRLHLDPCAHHQRVSASDVATRAEWKGKARSFVKAEGRG